MKTPLDLSTLILYPGAHEEPKPGEEPMFCALEAVSYMDNDFWGDSPSCVDSAIADIVRAANDKFDHQTRQRLIKILPSLIGTRGSDQLRNQRNASAQTWVTTKILPMLLAFAGVSPLLIDQKHARPLTRAALRTVIDCTAARLYPVPLNVVGIDYIIDIDITDNYALFEHYSSLVRRCFHTRWSTSGNITLEKEVLALNASIVDSFFVMLNKLIAMT